MGREDSATFLNKLKNSQDYYDDIREKRRNEYMGYLEEEIKLKRIRREAEEERRLQEERYAEEKYRYEQDVLQKRYQDELRRDVKIDPRLIEKNAKVADKSAAVRKSNLKYASPHTGRSPTPA